MIANPYYTARSLKKEEERANLTFFGASLVKELTRKLFTAMLLTCLMLIASQAEAGLIAHYAFNTGALTTDSSGNGRDLTAVNSPSPSGNPRFGSNSSEYVNAENDYYWVDDNAFGSFGTGDFAVSLWYQRTDANTYDLIGNGNRYFAGTEQNAGFTFSVSGTNNNPTLTLYNGQNGILTASPTFGGAGDEDDDEYKHVVFQRDSGEFQIWVDGTEVSQVNNVFDLNYTQLAFSVGATAINDSGVDTAPTEFFDGLLDEIFVFDMALTSDQINGLTNNNTFPGINGGSGSSGGIPEPTSLVLLSLGLLFSARMRRRGR